MLDKIELLANKITKQQKETLIRRGVGCQCNLDNANAIIKQGKKYTRIDIGRLDSDYGSGKLMIDEQGEIYGIKAYGVIHRGHHYGNLDTIDSWYWGEYYPHKL